MTVEFSLIPEDWAGWAGVHESLAELRRSSDEFAQFACEQLAEFDGLASLLDEHERQLAEQRSELSSQSSQLDARRQELENESRACAEKQQQLESEAARLFAAHEELDAARRLLEESQIDTAADVDHRVEELASRLERAEADRERLAAELSKQCAAAEQAAAAQSARVVELESALAEARAELAARPALVEHANESDALEVAEALRAELGRVQSERDAIEEELRTTRSQTERLAGATMELAEVRAALADAQTRLGGQPACTQSDVDDGVEQQLETLERERETLEIELETVRNRAVELAEVAAEEKRRNAEERAEWSSELKQLRRALEQQSSLLLRYQDSVSEHEPAAAAIDERASRLASDPVLDSVMAQFEMLQQDLVRRRTSHRKPPKQGVA